MFMELSKGEILTSHEVLVLCTREVLEELNDKKLLFCKIAAFQITLKCLFKRKKNDTGYHLQSVYFES